jgi:hypothetical protein
MSLRDGLLFWGICFGKFGALKLEFAFLNKYFERTVRMESVRLYPFQGFVQLLWRVDDTRGL